MKVSGDGCVVVAEVNNIKSNHITAMQCTQTEYSVEVMYHGRISAYY